MLYFNSKLSTFSLYKYISGIFKVFASPPLQAGEKRCLFKAFFLGNFGYLGGQNFCMKPVVILTSEEVKAQVAFN